MERFDAEDAAAWAAMALAHCRREPDPRVQRALGRYLRLFGAPHYATLDSCGLAGLLAEMSAAKACALRQDAEASFTPDPELLALCLETLLEALPLTPETHPELRVHVIEEHREQIPCLSIQWLGGHRPPRRLGMDGLFRMDFEELGACWTLATRGGRIDRADAGLTLRLKGIRMPPEPLAIADQLARVEGGAGAAWRILTPEAAREPGDAARAFVSAVTEWIPRLESVGLRYVFEADAALPAVPLNRPAFVRAAHALCAYAEWNLAEGGEIAGEAAYDREARAIRFSFTLTGDVALPSVDYMLDALSEAIEDGHGGTIEIECGEGGAIFMWTLPDPAGAALDAWIPGWEAFTPAACTYLRLLKSGAPAPPEAFLLEGILEDELLRRLMPRLQRPMAQRIAAAFNGPDAAPPSGHSSDRMLKAVSQIARGKPKKEICRPPYAGELIFAFGRDERGREMLGIGRLEPERVVDLAAALLEQPPDFARALRHAAEWAVPGE